MHQSESRAPQEYLKARARGTRRVRRDRGGLQPNIHVGECALGYQMQRNRHKRAVDALSVERRQRHHRRQYNARLHLDGFRGLELGDGCGTEWAGRRNGWILRFGEPRSITEIGGNRHIEPAGAAEPGGGAVPLRPQPNVRHRRRVRWTTVGQRDDRRRLRVDGNEYVWLDCNRVRSERERKRNGCAQRELQRGTRSRRTGHHRRSNLHGDAKLLGRRSHATATAVLAGRNQRQSAEHLRTMSVDPIRAGRNGWGSRPEFPCR